MKNVGKIFEQCFANSIPKDCYIHRLKDSAQSYNKTASFTWDNPCDFFVVDDKHGLFYMIECKTTKFKSMAFQENKDDAERMIKYHQIKSLTDVQNYKNIIPCFILNFRSEIDGKNIERTYFIHIKDFNRMIKEVNKKSFSEIDLIKYKAKKIQGHLKRVYYTWDLETLFKEVWKEHN